VAVANGAARIGVTLNHNAAYSVSEKALAKWSDERTQLVERKDRTIEALFRFEGTTCSNLGYPLRFDYRVVLDSPENDYRILDATCGPSPGDEGYTLMCKYLKDADGLMSAIETEKPLLGKPLDDVFGWDRKFSPTGCYCDTAGRAHKWGLALEVIHFALVRHELEKLNQEPKERTAEMQS
jgi:hypothetical protein